MANLKITELTAYTTPISTDVLPIVDVTTSTTKKITYANLATALGVSTNPVTATAVFGTDNVLLRSDGTGRGAQLSGITVGDSNNISYTIADGANVDALTITQSDTTNNKNGIVLAGATSKQLLKMTPTGSLGTNLATSGSFLMDYTNANGIVFQMYTNSTGASLTYPQILIVSANAAYNQPIVQITHNSGSGLGNSPNLRLDGAAGGGPQIEWRQTSDANYQVTGAGQFELQLKRRYLFLKWKKHTNTGFENSVWFLRPSTTDSMNGHVGIGVNPYGIEKLTIGNTTGGAPRIALKETTAPTADAGYGKIYVKSSDSDLYYMDGAGTETNISATGSGDFVGPSVAVDNTIVRFDGVSGKLGQASTVSINDNGGISSTIALAGNTVALTLVQNDTTNNPKAVSLTNAGTGNTVFIDANGDTGSTASTSGALIIENTGNAGFGLNVYSNHATFAQSLAFMKLDNAGATGNLLRLDNDGTGHAVLINQNSATSVSTSVGGAVLLTNTLNDGSGLVIYSNNGTNTAGANLLAVRADNTAFTGAVMAISNDGTGAALSINGTGGTGVGVTISSAGTGTNHSLGVNYTGTSATAAAGSFTSSNTAFSTLQVSGHEFGHGTLKLSHVGDGISSDGNAAGISIDLQNSDGGTGTTAAQGIFVTSTTGGTTGAILQLKNNMLALGGADLQVGIAYLSAGGNFGLGTPTATTPIEKLTLGTGGLNKPIFALAETTAPTATASYGKMYVKSADSALFYMTGAGTEYNLIYRNYYRAITALRTLDTTDYFIDCTANTFTVTLPTAVGITGREYVIKNSGTGVITIDGNGTETIDGALTQVLGTQYDFYRITSDGANWKITG